MPRYVSKRPRSEDEWLEEWPFTPDLQVDMQEAQDTGLVDAHGGCIMRLPNSIGFHARIEE